MKELRQSSEGKAPAPCILKGTFGSAVGSYSAAPDCWLWFHVQRNRCPTRVCSSLGVLERQLER